MNKTLRLAALPLMSALLATGCASLNAAQTANTMGKGAFQFGLEPAVEAFSGNNGLGTTYAPRVDLALRYGITDSIDIGGKVGSSLIELNAKFQLTDPANKSLVLSLAPSLGGFVFGSAGNTAGSFTIKVPLLIGIGVGDGNQLVFGPNIQDIIVEASGDNTNGDGSTASTISNLFCLGASVGFVLKAGEGFRLMPEFGVLIPVTGVSNTNGTSTSAGLGSSGFLWQAGLTFLFGSYHQPG